MKGLVVDDALSIGADEMITETVPMSTRTEAVLYESEAALRLLDHQLHEFGHEPASEPQQLTVNVGELLRSVDHANQQIICLLAQLRQSRSALQRTVLKQRQMAPETMRDAMSATEDATTVLVEMERRLVEVARLLDMGSTRGALGAPSGREARLA